MMLPERTAMRMVDEQGWILRNDIVWDKPNHMPSSVKDRLSNGWEHIYLFTKAKKYYFNLDAIREASSGAYSFNLRVRDLKMGKIKGPEWKIHGDGSELTTKTKQQNYPNRQIAGFNERWKMGQIQNAQKFGREGHSGNFDKDGNSLLNPAGKNPGDVWRITTKPYREAHFATFPPDLPERCIKAGCPDGGTVLDPFAGSGTTLMVAMRRRLNIIGIEIKPDYCRLIEKRCQIIGNLAYEYELIK
jgi:site-specific DNA-methyltransferase (cytosine-N4-specific)